MKPVLLVKSGVRFDRILPAGFRLLAALDHAARTLEQSFTITSATDSHKPTDPHTLGEAYDVRSHDMSTATKGLFLRQVFLDLQDGDPVETSGGIATASFFGFLENPGQAHEHWHLQRRKGRKFPNG